MTAVEWSTAQLQELGFALAARYRVLCNRRDVLGAESNGSERADAVLALVATMPPDVQSMFRIVLDDNPEVDQ